MHGYWRLPSQTVDRRGGSEHHFALSLPDLLSLFFVRVSSSLVRLELTVIVFFYFSLYDQQQQQQQQHSSIVAAVVEVVSSSNGEAAAQVEACDLTLSSANSNTDSLVKCWF